ncbi:MAG: hypothetical protein CL627_14605 [Aurantimonas sp.]|nr:hypothetical protein [Aurantimonas sp.]|tara:strand:+ start:497 stop:784 length:288 start_codon:yes stop_codon:yes gene_type:complete
MTRTAQGDRALAHAFDDLECLVQMATERTNVVWILSQLTIVNAGHKLSVEETAALIRAIEDADEASSQLLAKWTDQHDRARNMEDGQKKTDLLPV